MGKNTPIVLKYLDISTGHITKKDNKLLAKGIESLVYDPYPYGYRVHVNQEDLMDDLLSMRRAGLSKYFRDIIKWAYKKDMDWVQFDIDGPTYPKFKTFNW